MSKHPMAAHYKTFDGCLAGVYGCVMHIYVITCLVNGKRYVGRTTRQNAQLRWNEHCCAARKDRDCGIIPRAIHKHGKDAFTFEIVETVSRLEDLPARESHWIAHFDCLSPKGYNLETYQPMRVLTEEGKQRISRSQQGLRKKVGRTSRYAGVYRSRGRWVALLTYRGTDHYLSFPTEDEAAIAYDKVARHLCGPSAVVNHPEAVYSDAELAATYAAFVAPKSTSRFKGVHYEASLDKWKGVVLLPDGGSRVRVTDNEVEAAQFVDVVRVLYLGVAPETLNFPERYPQYQTLDEQWLKQRAYIPLTKGVTKRGNRYLGRLGNGGSLWHGSFATHEEAVAAVAAKRRELGMTWDL